MNWDLFVYVIGIAISLFVIAGSLFTIDLVIRRASIEAIGWIKGVKIRNERKQRWESR